jgi:hypothetical protein
MQMADTKAGSMASGAGFDGAARNPFMQAQRNRIAVCH